MTNTEKYFLVGIVGILTGIGLVAIAGGGGVKKVVIQPREDKPAVMRIYKIGTDQILVENPKLKGEYKILSNHLETITSKADRNVEEAEIKKVVEWYTK